MRIAFWRSPVKPCPSAMTAAGWWGARLRADQNGFNVPDDFGGGGYIAMQAAGIRQQMADGSPGDEAMAIFEMHLAVAITRQLEHLEKRYRKTDYPVPPVTLSVDWAPQGTLSDALKAAGLANYSMALPTKSCMHVYRSAVTVMPGYRASYVDVPIVDSGLLPRT